MTDTINTPIDTTRVPRPTADDRAWAGPEFLRAAQDRWDAAEATRKGKADTLAASVAEMDERKRREREQASTAARRVRDARLAEARAQVEASLRFRYLNQPGATEADWQRDKERVIADHFAGNVTAGAGPRLRPTSY